MPSGIPITWLGGLGWKMTLLFFSPNAQALDDLAHGIRMHANVRALEQTGRNLAYGRIAIRGNNLAQYLLLLRPNLGRSAFSLRFFGRVGALIRGCHLDHERLCGSPIISFIFVNTLK